MSKTVVSYSKKVTAETQTLISLKYLCLNMFHNSCTWKVREATACDIFPSLQAATASLSLCCLKPPTSGLRFRRQVHGSLPASIKRAFSRNKVVLGIYKHN